MPRGGDELHLIISLPSKKEEEEEEKSYVLVGVS